MLKFEFNYHVTHYCKLNIFNDLLYIFIIIFVKKINSKKIKNL